MTRTSVVTNAHTASRVRPDRPPMGGTNRNVTHPRVCRSVLVTLSSPLRAGAWTMDG